MIYKKGDWVHQKNAGWLVRIDHVQEASEPSLEQEYIGTLFSGDDPLEGSEVLIGYDISGYVPVDREKVDKLLARYRHLVMT